MRENFGDFAHLWRKFCCSFFPSLSCFILFYVPVVRLKKETEARVLFRVSSLGLRGDGRTSASLVASRQRKGLAECRCHCRRKSWITAKTRMTELITMSRWPPSFHSLLPSPRRPVSSASTMKKCRRKIVTSRKTLTRRSYLRIPWCHLRETNTVLKLIGHSCHLGGLRLRPAQLVIRASKAWPVRCIPTRNIARPSRSSSAKRLGHQKSSLLLH
ncbi:hypothetical protein RvY_11452-2 [Ramazzottius varieornatus]|uniref:Uncharacterized protein n=1 Tax=Ramazzottius varieornatus TaxID=947166 RepID=A0A1D1VLK1_RAMVA|nr:hypothetical protein RvY_11452-2 [Ramazzottius varieornatus]